MPTTEYPTPLIRYLRVQEDFEVQLRQLLDRAYNDSAQHLLQLEGDSIGNAVRRSQIRSAQVAINQELSRLWRDAGSLIEANRAQAAAAAAQSMMDPVIPMLQAAGLGAQEIDVMLRSQKATAARGVENAISRVTLTKLPLSERVYASRVMVSGQLDRIITSAIARGVSAHEMANLVKPFINPNTPGGVNYAAQRLGRSELNNAFHGTQVQQGIKSPFVTAMRWHLSGSHPRPDECNDYETGGDLPDGLWTPGRVPGKPHPNCLCWLEPEGPTREQFIQQFQAGQYDDFLNENGVSTGAPVPKFPAKASDPLQSYRSLEKLRPGGAYRFQASDALEYYKGYGYAPINNSLRGVAPGVDSTGKTVAKAKLQSSIRGLDTDFKRNGVALPEDTTVLRGLRPEAPVNQYVEGEYVVEAGYSSTTLGQSTAERFTRPVGDWSKGQGDGWIIEIMAPKGTRTLIPGNAGGEEFEVLLNRNTKFRVLKVDSENRKIWMEISP